MHKSIRLLIPAFLFFGCVGFASPLLRADDLANLQGKWQMTQKANNTQIIKTIKGHSETFEIYEDGMLVYRHVVTFSLESHGPAKVFAWKNGQIKVGTNAGDKLADGRFIYRLDKSQWIAVHGMLDGEQSQVRYEVFERMPPDKPH